MNELRDQVQERPILFSTPMVQAILKKIKHMTRRTRGLEKINEKPDEWILRGLTFSSVHGVFVFQHQTTGDSIKIKCPYGKPGDILWVRETWAKIYNEGDKPYYEYYADSENPLPGEWPEEEKEYTTLRWKPSIHMPRAACRIRLKITDIRIERLQDITEEDAKAEGLYAGYKTTETSSVAGTAKQAFMWIWQKINGNVSWLENPWVWVVSFERI